MSRRVAAIDCGTNSVRLLISEVDAASGLAVDVAREMRIVRLGEGVDANGRLSDAALSRTFAAVDEYAGLIEDNAVDAVRFVATSATRDAANREEFISGIRGRLGVEPEVISGDEEAALSFAGATGNLDIAGAAPPCLVVDIGGGSTEFIVGSARGEMSFAISLDIGSVRLTERFLKTSPPAAADLAAAAAYVDGLLESSAVDLTSVGTWIGVAGTATTLAGVYLELAEYDRERVHGASIPRADLAALLDRLSRMTVEEIRALPSMHPGRADVVTGGTLIASRVAVHVPVPDMIVSESDILDGIALELLAAH